MEEAQKFAESRTLLADIIAKARKVSKGKSLEAGIETSWLRTYGIIARRCRDDKDFRINPFPFE